MIREMIPDDLAASNPLVAEMRDRWFLGSPAKVIYAFERGTVACTLITQILADPGLRTHEYLDQAGSEQQIRSLRSVLVDHGLLPPRDELLARFEAWLPVALARIVDPKERLEVTRYARWRHLRALRKKPAPISAKQLSWRRIEILEIIDLLDWINRRGGSLASLSQAHFDEWLSTGRRFHIHHFAKWTSHHHITGTLIAPTPKSNGISLRSIADDERWRLLADITGDAGVDPHTKFAAGLLLIFGVRASRIVQIRAEDITASAETVLVRLGTAPLVLPAELAPAAQHAANNRTAPRMFVESVAQEWVFPGVRAGNHMASDTLNRRLRAVGISPRAARASALMALVQQLPPVVLSRLTGLEIHSAIDWSNAIAANSSAYASAVIDRMDSSFPDLAY